MMELLEDRLAPAANTYTVTGLADGGGVVTGTAPNFSATTLRGAIAAATADGGDNTITFDSGIFTNDAATITLSAAPVNSAASLGAAAFVISTNITIQGPAADGGIDNQLIVSGMGSSNKFRFATVGSTGNLTLKNITLTNFYVKGGDGGFTAANQDGGGGGLGAGGAILNYMGNLNLVGVAINGCTAQGGAGGGTGQSANTSTANGGSGGGMGSSAIGNTPGGPNPGTSGAGYTGGIGGGGLGGTAAGMGGYGGGGAGQWGSATTGQAGGFGGGGGGKAQNTYVPYFIPGGAGGFGGGTAGVLVNWGGAARLRSGAGAGGAGMGGAIFNLGGTVSITNSTFTGNSAVGGAGGGALVSYESWPENGSGLGGAIFNLNGGLTLTSSTVSGNTVSSLTNLNNALAINGGTGIYNLSDGEAQVTAITGPNSTSSVTMNNSIVGEGNYSSALADFVSNSVHGGSNPTLAGSNNIISNNSPSLTTTLTADVSGLGNTVTPIATNMSDTSTTVTVSYTSYMNITPGSTVVQVDNEAMLVTAVNTATNTLTVTRGYYGSTATSHNANGNYLYSGTYLPVADPAAIIPNTTLASGADIHSTTIAVADARALNIVPNATYLQVDGEQMLVTAVNGNTLTVTRGQNVTLAAAHSPVAPVYAVRSTTIRVDNEAMRVTAVYGNATDGYVLQVNGQSLGIGTNRGQYSFSASHLAGATVHAGSYSGSLKYSTLSAAMTDTTTGSLTVSNAAALSVTPNATVVSVENELMLVSAVNGNTLTVTRGFNGSTAATHAIDAAVYYLEGGALSGFTASAIATGDPLLAATTLNGALNSSTTSLVVADATQLGAIAFGSTVVVVDGEQMVVVNVIGNNLTVSRGANGATATAHAAGAFIYVSNNGGPTPTVSLRSGSPAIAAGLATGAPVTFDGSSASQTGMTVTVMASNTFSAGQPVTISGLSPTVFNGTFTIATASATQFTYTTPATGLGVATGTGTAFVVPPNDQRGTSRGAMTGQVDIGAVQVTVPIPAPTVSSITRFIGPTSGGNYVVIAGANFTDATSVTFGITAVTAPDLTVDSATLITVKVPAGSAGLTEVTVTTPGGTSTTAGAGNDYTYAVPAVLSVEVNGGEIQATDALGVVPVLAGQNSIVEQLLVTFNQTVTLDANAFEVQSLASAVTVSGGINPSTANVSVTATGRSGFGSIATGFTQYILTFNADAGTITQDNTATGNGGVGNIFQYLKDGFYQLYTDGTKVHAGGSLLGETGTTSSEKFWALYGAALPGVNVFPSSPVGDGNTILLVDSFALDDIYASFGSFSVDPVGPPPYYTAYDSNLDGLMDSFDLDAMYANFGTVWQF